MTRVFPWGAAEPADSLAHPLVPDRFESRSWAVTAAPLFSPEECAAIIALRRRTGADGGTLVGGIATEAVRRSSIVWLDEDDPAVAWIGARLTRAVADLNHQHFGFALAGFDEQIQLTEYTAEQAGFYDWHSDVGGRGVPRTRKLTLTVQLSAPEDYDGGALELNPAGTVIEAPRGQGTGTAFPSYTLHRVCPVSRGVRHSLVVWTHGPRFV